MDYRVFIFNLDCEQSWTKSYDDQTKGYACWSIGLVVFSSTNNLCCLVSKLYRKVTTISENMTSTSEQFKKGKDLRKDVHAVQKLRSVVEKAKWAVVRCS